MTNTHYVIEKELASRHEHGAIDIDHPFLVRYIGENLVPVRTHTDLTVMVVWEDTPEIHELYFRFYRPEQQRRAGGKRY